MTCLCVLRGPVARVSVPFPEKRRAVAILEQGLSLCPQETLLFLTVGDEKEAGLFLLAGPVEAVENLGPRYHVLWFL